MENLLVWFVRQKVIIFEAKWLVHYLKKQKANASFLNDNFQSASKKNSSLLKTICTP
jgi:hypothetical protein